MTRNKRFPRYEDDADYTTNAPSYYHDLGRKNKLLEKLARKIWEYDETLDLTLEELIDRLESYIEENDNLMNERLEQWDLNLENFPENVELLLQEWLTDGTLDHIINDTIFNWKADKTFVESEIVRLEKKDENITTQLAQTVINVNSFGAVGDGVTDDTNAIKMAISKIDNNYKNLYFPSGNYLITESLGVIEKDINIVGNNTTLFIDNDVDILVTLNGISEVSNLTVDHNGHTLLGEYSFKVNNETVFKNVHFKNVLGYGYETLTQNQYFVWVNTISKKVQFNDCTFNNIKNYGDGVGTQYGFAGFIFVYGDGLSAETLNVSVNNCEFNETQTLYYENMVEDYDADGFRVYIKEDTPHSRKNLIVSFNNNLFKDNHKRFYKINDSTVYINGDKGFESEKISEQMLSIAQFNNSDIIIKNSDYSVRFVEGFIVYGNSNITIEDSTIKNNVALNTTNARLISQQSTHTEPCTFSVDNLYLYNIGHIVRVVGDYSELTIDIKNIKGEHLRSIAIIDGAVKRFSLKNIDVSLDGSRGVFQDNGLFIGENITGEVILDDIMVKELSYRPETSNVYLFHIQSPCVINKFVVTGVNTSSRSGLRVTANGTLIKNCFVYNIRFEGLDITSLNNVYVNSHKVSTSLVNQNDLILTEEKWALLS